MQQKITNVQFNRCDLCSYLYCDTYSVVTYTVIIYTGALLHVNIKALSTDFRVHYTCLWLQLYHYIDKYILPYEWIKNENLTGF